jgi:hypothetical protein
LIHSTLLNSSVGKVILNNIFKFSSDEAEVKHKTSSEEKEKNDIPHKA